MLGRCAWWATPVLLDVAIDEGPLRRVVGDQDVMGRQLTRLVQSQRVASPVLDQSGGGVRWR